MKKKLIAVKTGAVIYTRVSSERQVDNMSLGEQERICRSLCQSKEWTIDRVFVEEGESAKTANRTQLQALLEYCRQNKNRIGFIVVYKLDRFSRKVEDHTALRSLLLKMGINLVSASEPINESTTGKLLENVLASFAQFDNDMRAERSRGGMAARVREGCWVSKAPTGYVNIKNELKQPTLGISKENDRKLYRFFSKVLEKELTQTAAYELALKMEIRSNNGSIISRNGVIKMLRNPVYAGHIQNDLTDGKMIKGIHPAVVTLEQFMQIQDILDGKTRNRLPVKKRRDKYPLRGFLLCGTCGKTMTASASKGRTRHYAAYHCSVCTKKTAGNAVRIPMEKAHQQFGELLSKAEPAPWVPNVFREIVLRRWNQDFKEVQEERRRIDKELEVAEKKKNALVDRLLDETISQDVYREQENRLAIRRAELETARQGLKEAEGKREQIVDQAISFLIDLPQSWQAAPLEDKRRFQNAVYEAGIRVYPNMAFGTTTLSPILQETTEIERQFEDNKKDLSEEKSLVVTLPGIEPGLQG